jgi:hypothetical protein
MGEATYADLRAELEEALSELVAAAEERESRAVAEASRDLAKKLAEERFNAVVVGEFKRGKTTFVNALLGAEVLPAAVVPLTSIVTAVTWGDPPRAEVRYLDGRVEEVAPEDLARFVTERDNPGNRLGVDRAVLHWAAEDLRDGVFLVDTPGVGSVYRHTGHRRRDSLGGLARSRRREALFIPSDRSTRSTSDVAVFTKGWARLPAWHAVDSGAFHLTRQIAISMRPVVRFEIEGQHVPSFELEGIYQLEGACRGGGVEVPARQPTDMATLSWPSGWDVVAGLLRRHGLVAQPSGSGRIAAGFLRRAGSIPGIRPLLSASVIGLLYDLAERRGTARFKRQIRELASEIATSVETPEEQLNRIEERLAALTLPGSEEERSDVTFDHIIGRLGDSKAAKAWLRWGERSGLVLRGLVLRCEECRRKDWSPIGDLAPPWTCRWCGAQLRQPFPAGQVPFRYAASSTTLSLVGEDAISHLLALRWFYDLFSGDRKVLYGAYPGVTIRRAGSTKDIGEADVLLVFSNGWLVPGEVKLRSSGWSAEDVWKLDILTEALDAP